MLPELHEYAAQIRSMEGSKWVNGLIDVIECLHKDGTGWHDPLHHDTIQHRARILQALPLSVGNMDPKAWTLYHQITFYFAIEPVAKLIALRYHAALQENNADSENMRRRCVGALSNLFGDCP
jgi:hypothetical protein